MSVPVEPPELARLLDFTERPRVDDWSFRAALTRYAQPQPERVGGLLELVRHIEFALGPELKSIERNGAEIWQTLQSTDAPDGSLVDGLLRAIVLLDQLGDVLAAWAADPGRDRPDAEVDTVAREVARQLKQLGAPREPRQRPTRARG